MDFCSKIVLENAKIALHDYQAILEILNAVKRSYDCKQYT